jgi:hypothetical protein
MVHVIILIDSSFPPARMSSPGVSDAMLIPVCVRLIDLSYGSKITALGLDYM